MNLSEDIDYTLLKKLKKLGFELNEKRPVTFYFYFTEEHQAYYTAAELHNLLFKINIIYTDFDDKWLCLAEKSINVTPERLADLRDWMEALAQCHEGEYDGWETGFEVGSFEE